MIPPPPWPLVQPLINAGDARRLDHEVSDVAENDQVQAFSMGRLAALSIDVRLPHDLYGVLAVLGFVYECATNAGANDVLTGDEERGVKRLVLTLADALTELVPAEART